MSVKIEGDLSDWLFDQQRKLGKWRIKFINAVWDFNKDVGERMVAFAQSHARAHWWDTGTLHKRIDYKVVAWNNLVFGIIEPKDQYYDAARHYPTAAFLSKYRGWKPSPLVKTYAEYVVRKDPFIDKIVADVYRIELTRFVNDFIAKHPPV